MSHDPQTQFTTYELFDDINKYLSIYKHHDIFVKNNITYVTMDLPAGHVPELQPCCSVERPLHAVPPFSSCVLTFLVLTCSPPPQVLLQLAHVSHVPHAQLTESYNDQKYSNNLLPYDLYKQSAFLRSSHTCWARSSVAILLFG